MNPPKNLSFAAAILLAAIPQAYANLLVDRGLPTENLNNSAGSKRSNVAWADYETSATPSEYWVPGDSFSIANRGSYTVNDIRVWVVGSATSGLSLLGGVSGSSIGTTAIDTSYTVTQVNYADTSTYQGSGGGYLPIYQVDFAVDLSLTSGQTFDFFVNGPFATQYGSGFVNSFVHASNAGLSGSPQDGADNSYLWLLVNGSGSSVQTDNSATDGSWDKSSDLNVQVFGTVPDAGATVMLLGSALTGLAMFRRRLSA